VTEAAIHRITLGAAHDGDAELLVTLRYANGGETRIALDAVAAGHLMTACAAAQPDGLLGCGWEHVRNALEASSNRYVTPESHVEGPQISSCTTS